jgi:ammonia channel protein AmtB
VWAGNVGRIDQRLPYSVVCTPILQGWLGTIIDPDANVGVIDFTGGGPVHILGGTIGVVSTLCRWRGFDLRRVCDSGGVIYNWPAGRFSSGKT